MISNVILGVLTLAMLFILPLKFSNIFILLFGLLWTITPAVMWRISKEYKVTPQLEKLNDADKEYLLNLGKKTWQYFKEFINEKSNFLPPDNYQEDCRINVTAE